MSEDKPQPADPTMSISGDQTLSDERTKVANPLLKREYEKYLEATD